MMSDIMFEHLTKTYPNGFISVDDVTLRICRISWTERLWQVHDSSDDRRTGRYHIRKDLSW